MSRGYRSGSEALDAEEASALLLELCTSGLPDSGLSVARRARAYAKCAELARQVSEICAALARGLEPGAGSGSGGGR